MRKSRASLDHDSNELSESWYCISQERAYCTAHESCTIATNGFELQRLLLESLLNDSFELHAGGYHEEYKAVTRAFESRHNVSPSSLNLVAYICVVGAVA